MKQAKLANIIELNPRNRQAYAPSELVGFVPMAAVSEAGAINEIVERPFQEVAKGYTSFMNGDVLLAKITPCMENGKAAIVGGLRSEVGFGSTEFHVLRPKPELNAKYLFHFIHNEGFRREAAKNMTGTAGQKRVPTAYLAELSIPLPPLDDQIRIATVLSRAEQLIAKRKDSIKALDELVKSTFLEMFGRYLDGKAESAKPIGQVVKFIDYRGKTQARVSEGIPHISAKCVRRGYFDESRLDYITEDTYNRIMTRGYPKANDVLFTTEGATMGFVCRVPRSFKKFAVGQRIISLQCQDNLKPEYLDFLLNHSSIQKQVFKRSSGSAAIRIRSSEFEQIEIPIPELAIQNQFAAVVEKVEALKAKYQQSLVELENLYGSLSQRAFKGELDLSGVRV